MKKSFITSRPGLATDTSKYVPYTFNVAIVCIPHSHFPQASVGVLQSN